MPQQSTASVLEALHGSAAGAKRSADGPASTSCQQSYQQLARPPVYADRAQLANGRTYLCWFLHRLLDLRRSDVEACAQLAGCADGDIAWALPHGSNEYSPFWYLMLPSEAHARRVAERSLLTRVRTACTGVRASSLHWCKALAH
jgi:hypothetical protein